MWKKVFIAVVAIIMVITFTMVYAYGETTKLPDIKNWQNGELRTTSFDALSGNKGKWLERNYRTNNGTTFKAIWMEGEGPKGWKAVEPASSKDIWGGVEAEKLTIGGEEAILEHRPVVGYSLVISIGKEGVLTMESANADKRDLLDAAETLVKNMK